MIAVPIMLGMLESCELVHACLHRMNASGLCWMTSFISYLYSMAMHAVEHVTCDMAPPGAHQAADHHHLLHAA